MSSPFLIFSPLLPIRHLKFSHRKFSKISKISIFFIVKKSDHFWPETGRKRSSKRGGHFQQSNQLLEKSLQEWLDLFRVSIIRPVVKCKLQKSWNSFKWNRLMQLLCNYFFHFLSLLKLPLENLKNPLESAKIILLKTKNMPKN